MFGKLPVVGEMKFGKWIDSAIRILIMNKIWMVYFGESGTICQTFPLCTVQHSTIVRLTPMYTYMRYML